LTWDNAKTIAFTRLEIVARVPSVSGVFAIMDGQRCLLVADTWNLKARLLDLANVLDGQEELSILYETCPDEERDSRKSAVMRELALVRTEEPHPERMLPGLKLRDTLPRSA
jgi:hypothetical protein